MRHPTGEIVRHKTDPHCTPGTILESQPERDHPTYWYRVEFQSMDGRKGYRLWVMHDNLVVLSGEYEAYGEF